MVYLRDYKVLDLLKKFKGFVFKRRPGQLYALVEGWAKQLMKEGKDSEIYENPKCAKWNFYQN